MSNWKHLLAREWLYLCGIVLFTFIVWSVFFTVFVDEGVRYFGELAGGMEVWFAWFLTLAPYLLVQLVRSLVWASKTLKKSE